MWESYFQFEGGSLKQDNNQFKFHCFVVDNDKNEHFLFSAANKGLVNKVPYLNCPTLNHFDQNCPIYRCIVPVIKLFTATQGFGVAKEYFSYFIVLEPKGKKFITIQPLGHEQLTRNWIFRGAGRFMTSAEIRRYFGADSQTYKFFTRQSFLSKRRLQSMVNVQPYNKKNLSSRVEEEEVRLLRID